MISSELGMICAELIYAIHLISTFVEEFNCAVVQIAQQIMIDVFKLYIMINNTRNILAKDRRPDPLTHIDLFTNRSIFGP